MSNQENANIKHVNFDSHFKTLPNRTAHDRNLSWNAKGLLWYIMSLPPNWQIHTWQLAQVYQGDKNGGGIDAIKAMMTELREAGYVEYKKTKNDKGQWVHNYTVYPIPFVEFKNMFPEPEVPPPEVPRLEVPPILISNELPKNELIKDPPPTPPFQTPTLKEIASKSLRSDGTLRVKEDSLIYEILGGLALSVNDKKRITQEFSEIEVMRAVRVSKFHQAKKGMMNLLMAILKNPDNWPDKAPTQSHSHAQQLALTYNDLLRKINRHAAEHNDNIIQDNIMVIKNKTDGFVQISLASDIFLIEIASETKWLEQEIKKIPPKRNVA